LTPADRGNNQDTNNVSISLFALTLLEASILNILNRRC